jgi:hypothetical protein
VSSRWRKGTVLGEPNHPAVHKRQYCSDPETQNRTGDPAHEGEKKSLGEELDLDLFACCAQRSTEPDLSASFEHGDDHRVGDTDPADEKRNGPESEEQTVEGLVCGIFRGKGVRGPTHLHLSGLSGVRCRCEEQSQAVDLLVRRPLVDRRGRAVA